MSPAQLHADSIVIDGLIIAKWNRELFEDMRKGGLTAANCTVSVWEGFQATINNIVASQTLIRENSDLVIPVKTTADILNARPRNRARPASSSPGTPTRLKTSSATSRSSSSSASVWCRCATTPRTWWAPAATSATASSSGFGREIVAEMNRVGIMCDLSHVGSKTSEEVILESKKPVC